MCRRFGCSKNVVFSWRENCEVIEWSEVSPATFSYSLNCATAKPGADPSVDADAPILVCNLANRGGGNW